MKRSDFFKGRESGTFAELKQLVYANDYIVKPEKNGNKLILNKFFFENKIEISLNAIAWFKNNYLTYKSYQSKFIIQANEIQNYSYHKLKIILLSDIYKQVIKNNIMMI